MKMADLEGRIYSPIMRQEQDLINNRAREKAERMKQGERIVIQNKRMGVLLNRKHGSRTFSTKTEEGKVYLIRNK